MVHQTIFILSTPSTEIKILLTADNATQLATMWQIITI